MEDFSSGDSLSSGRILEGRDGRLEMGFGRETSLAEARYSGGESSFSVEKSTIGER